MSAKYKHRNYDWAKDGKSRLPGWNFLTFAKPRFKNVFVRFTEYEPVPGRRPLKRPRHPNTAREIWGLELAVRPRDLSALEKVFGGELSGDRARLGGLTLLLKPGRATRIAALVVKCGSLKRFSRAAKIASEIRWRGRRAELIRNPDRRMWDIVAID